MIVGFEVGAMQKELVKSQDQSGQILGVFAKLRKVTTGFVTPVCPSIHPFTWNNSAATGWIFTNLIFQYF